MSATTSPPRSVSASAGESNDGGSRATIADLADAPTLIERQFPVARVSAEAYKERKAGHGQTLTGLGKWWGRKPLLLVRAVLLALLLPASDDPRADMECLLALLTMDDPGLARRLKSIPAKRLLTVASLLPDEERARFYAGSEEEGYSLREGLDRAELRELQEVVLRALPYTEKLSYCLRPEEIAGPSSETWQRVNAQLGTDASSLPELVRELGERRFGRLPRVGDSYCGGGSIPFEATRLGFDSYGSDLNPVAALLTYAAVNIVAGGEDRALRATAAQRRALERVSQRFSEWGVESDANGRRARAFLYCVEVIDPESGWRVPLAPSWVVSKQHRVVGRLVPDAVEKRYRIVLVENASDEELERASKGTARAGAVHPPGGEHPTSYAALRGRDGLRLWRNDELVPGPADVYQERLWCVAWEETIVDAAGKKTARRTYSAPDADDLAREQRVLELLQERFHDWQERGVLPSRRIVEGEETERVIRERGWTHWHHLFTPRQLLTLGLIAEQIDEQPDELEQIALLLLLGRVADYNSRLAMWESLMGKVNPTFYNQALNTLASYAVRGSSTLSSLVPALAGTRRTSAARVACGDARRTAVECDYWLTDPPYADAVNYEEISEFFLAWYAKPLERLFPGWPADSRRAIAVKGAGEAFRESMVACYKRLAEQMPKNGRQVVMFTHQDSGVWADLALILWAAGLQVTAAWCILTETEPGFRTGNYVQGTVLLVLRKRDADAARVYLNELTPLIEREVRAQLDTMTQLDDESDPNFGDADYQLAAYAAALRVVTAQPIAGLNVEDELARPRRKGEESILAGVIRNAVKVACDHLILHGITRELWIRLEPSERFYLKALELESHGELRHGAYQELARGFGIRDYMTLLSSGQANATRVLTASDWGLKQLGQGEFGVTLVRQVLQAIQIAARDDNPGAGVNYLRTELSDYWGSRERAIQLIDYVARYGRIAGMEHWRKDSEAAETLAGMLRNDYVS